MAIAKEQIRQIISQNDINRVTDVYALLKDILQELMEAELDASFIPSDKQQPKSITISTIGKVYNSGIIILFKRCIVFFFCDFLCFIPIG